MLDSLLSQVATPRLDASTGSGSALPAPIPGTALAAGASHLVEATTTEEALAEVQQLLGPEARIVDARRVRRGGIGGFFAKEVVQLHASTSARAATEQTSAAHARSTTTSSGGGGPSPSGTAGPTGGSPVDRLLAELDDAPEDVDFGTYLREQLAPPDGSRDDVRARGSYEPPPGQPDQAGEQGKLTALLTAAHPAPWLVERQHDDPGRAGPVADVAVGSARDMDGWSSDTLLRLGLPLDLVRSIERAGPSDDLAWTTALTDAIRPCCRPLPDGPSVLVGPRADELGSQGLVDVEVARSRAWLTAVRPGRWVHAVVGGDGWRRSLDDGPLAVSWTRNEDLPDALRCAAELGLVLGYGPHVSGPRRARPFDIALAIRDQVVTR